MRTMVLVLLLMISVCSYSGNEVGNGGDAVVCTHKTTTLDYTENEILQRYHLLAMTERDPYIIAENLFVALGKVDKPLSLQYLVSLKQFRERVRYHKNIALRDVLDSVEIAIPTGCEIKQAAIKVKDPLSDEVQFHVDDKIWNDMDTVNKASLIIHEIIYDHFSNLGEKNSVKARIFNSYLTSSEFQAADKDAYIKFFRSLKINYYPK